MAVAAQVMVANCSLFSWGCYSSQQSCELTTWFIAAENRRMVCQEVGYQVDGPRLPLGITHQTPTFPCLTLTTNSQVCSNNPSSALLWGFFFSTNCCLDGEERKQVGGWLVCETITLYYQPTCWGPKRSTLNQVWWFNVLFVYGQKLTDGMCAHPCPHLSRCWHKCDLLFELFWDVGGWTRNCCILAAGTVCKEGKAAVCVTNAAVGFRVSC